MIELTSRPGPALDRAVIEGLIGTCGEGGAEIVVALLDTLFDDAPQHLANLRRAVGDDDHGGVRLAAHTLKSHGLTFGASLLADLARELEIRARDLDLDGAGSLIDELEAEYGRVRLVLAGLQRELARPGWAGMAA